jgi:hypothetical protein
LIFVKKFFVNFLSCYYRKTRNFQQKSRDIYRKDNDGDRKEEFEETGGIVQRRPERNRFAAICANNVE